MLNKSSSRTLQTLLVVGLLVGAWFLSSSLLSAAPLTSSGSFRALLAFRSPIGNPELTLEKTISQANPKPGDIVTYRLTYANINSGSQAFNVRLYDFIPAGVNILSTNPVADYNADGVLIFNADSVGPGTEDVVVTIQAMVKDGYESLYNQALVTADGVTPTHASLLTAVTPLVRQVTLTKSGYPVVLMDDTLIYRIRCRNTGNTALSDLVLSDVLPPAVTYQTASQTPDSVSLPLLTWSLPSLDIDDVWEVVLTTTAPSEVSVITNTAFVDADQMDMVSRIFATQVISEGVIMYLEKTGSPLELYFGDQVVYTLTYQNIGNMVAENVLLTDTFPSDITVTGYNTAPLSINATRGVWELPSIEADASGSIVFTATVGGATERTLHNEADVNGPGPYDDSHAEFDIYLKSRPIYMPLILRGY